MTLARPTLPPKGETAEVHVFVLDTEKKPLAPCHPAVARKLLKQGRAAVLRRYPFTIILKEAKEATPQDIRLKIDPGSWVTGMAILHKNKVIWAAEIEHKGKQVRAKMLQRRQLRRGRRYRKTRYRKPRFLNRRKPEGWLPPSLESRIANIVTWVNRLIKLNQDTRTSIEENRAKPLFAGVFFLFFLERRCLYCPGFSAAPFSL